MSAPQSIMIDSVKYVREDSIDKSNNSGPKDLRIIILPRGWNIVGNYSEDDKGNVTITNASIIRVWGTTKGLGEIAKGGPNKDTKLDPTHGDVSLLKQNIIYTIKCESSKW